MGIDGIRYRALGVDCGIAWFQRSLSKG